MNYLEEEKEKENNKPWNYTKIESKNIHGNIDRNDNLPGHFGKVDLSLYYYDIQEKEMRFLIDLKHLIGHLLQEQIYKRIIIKGIFKKKMI